MAVPQATIKILLIEFKYFLSKSISGRRVFESFEILDPIVSLIDFGCSLISFNMKSG